MNLIDEPRWPAHGTTFAHLVSDASLSELLDFARSAGLPPRAFDHDHYDVPHRLHAELIARGARPVPSTELVRSLRASGCRVSPRDRTPKRRAAMVRLRAAWVELLPAHPELGEELITRWSAEGRHYHDVRHLASVLDALAHLAAHGVPDADSRPTVLAAWFHDAVYDGVPGADEDASAELALARLTPIVGGAEASEVGRLVRLTATHDPDADDPAGRALCDADLSILGARLGRYLVYARDVRLDYAHLDDATFNSGRRRVLESLLGRPRLFATDVAHDLWDAPARANLASELELMGQDAPAFPLQHHPS